ncbi:hypothetical protein, partial [Sporomusa sp.]|uniref:hypothetical protein n=1 Tax=Sporomusa sp. TaxID=2078658 RepID=UPI002CC47F0C
NRNLFLWKFAFLIAAITENNTLASALYHQNPSPRFSLDGGTAHLKHNRSPPWLTYCRAESGLIGNMK